MEISRTILEAPHQDDDFVATLGDKPWIGWALLVILPGLVMGLHAKLAPWVFMWLLAGAIFAGCKWLTLWQACPGGRGAWNWKQGAAYLLLSPSMDAQEFLAGARGKQKISAKAWVGGVAKAVAGASLIWAGGRLALRHPLVGGWVGMLGLVLLLHFGTFHLVALAWQSRGIRMKAIMQHPLASHSLGELWGQRWNLGFRALSHKYVFLPLQKRFGPVAATLGAFLASGLLHDLVISVPAGAGYGLPTAYFVVQGAGVVAERSEFGKRLGLGRGVSGWLWTAAIAVGPLGGLFHPWFVMRVMVPFLRAVAG